MKRGIVLKLSFSTLGCPKWSVSEILATAKDFGYDGIELRGVQSELHMTRHKALRPENIGATKAELDRMGLTIACVTSGCVISDADHREENREEIMQYVDAAKTLGAPHVRVLGDALAGPSVPVDDYLVEDMAAELGEYAGKNGVTLLMESNGAYADTNRLAKLLQDINCPHVKVIWDIHHPYRYFSEPPKETMQNLKGLIRHVHLKDGVMVNGRPSYRMMGQGDLPTRECIELLLESGFDGFYSLEWLKRFDNTLEDPGISFMQYVDYMRKF